jgi:pentatricopeptide repeat protein
LQLQGDWPAALEEADNACRDLAARSEAAAGRAYYQAGELCRLMGEFESADRMFREASRRGCEPQPGSALLLLATGKGDAVASIRGAINQSDERRGPLAGMPRPRLLGAAVDILLARGEIESARVVCDELSAFAEESGAAFPLAIAAQAAGSVGLAEGRHDRALVSLRDAWTTWQNLEMPYESARVRVLLGRVSDAMGDPESARMHYDAARSVLARLGASPDVRELDRLTGAGNGSAHGGLTDREREVLALVASGSSNRQIAYRLGISENTVARHVSNIFDKLGVNSRTQAVASAQANGLL